MVKHANHNNAETKMQGSKEEGTQGKQATKPAWIGIPEAIPTSHSPLAPLRSAPLRPGPGRIRVLCAVASGDDGCQGPGGGPGQGGVAGPPELCQRTWPAGASSYKRKDTPCPASLRRLPSRWQSILAAILKASQGPCSPWGRNETGHRQRNHSCHVELFVWKPAGEDGNADMVSRHSDQRSVNAETANSASTSSHLSRCRNSCKDRRRHLDSCRNPEKLTASKPSYPEDAFLLEIFQHGARPSKACQRPGEPAHSFTAQTGGTLKSWAWPNRLSGSSGSPRNAPRHSRSDRLQSRTRRGLQNSRPELDVRPTRPLHTALCAARHQY